MDQSSAEYFVLFNENTDLTNLQNFVQICFLVLQLNVVGSGHTFCAVGAVSERGLVNDDRLFDYKLWFVVHSCVRVSFVSSSLIARLQNFFFFMLQSFRCKKTLVVLGRSRYSSSLSWHLVYRPWSTQDSITLVRGWSWSSLWACAPAYYTHELTIAQTHSNYGDSLLQNASVSSRFLCCTAPPDYSSVDDEL